MQHFQSAAVTEPRPKKKKQGYRVQFDILQLDALTMDPEGDREESLVVSGRIGYFDKLFHQESANVIGFCVLACRSEEH